MPHYATVLQQIWSYTANQSAQNFFFCVNACPIIQGIYPENFTFISPVISEICFMMLLLYSISDHTPANQSAQTGCVYLAHNSRNLPLKSSVLYLQSFLRYASLWYFLWHIWSYTHQWSASKIILGVYTCPIIQGIYPEKFTFISPVIF